MNLPKYLRNGVEESRYIKGTIPISQDAISATLCLPTPLDFNNLRFVAALSRHGQMERQGIGRLLKEPDGIGEHK